MTMWTGQKSAKAALAALALVVGASGASAQPAAPEPAAAPVAAPQVAAPVAPAEPIAIPLTPAEEAFAVGMPAAEPGPGYALLPAEPGVGQPVPWGIDLQSPVTPVAQRGVNMVHYFLNPVMIGISILVLALMTWVIIRYRAARNPVPSRTSHNTAIEVIWTVVPALILVVIAVPSFRLLAAQYDPPAADLTIKATGFQWYWGYEYPDYGGVSFDALPTTREESLERGSPYLLDTDNRVVVPVGATVKMLITAGDVLHSWAVPAFWVKMDAVPGRINETWFRADREGVYFGQCSELCGVKHGFMPIAVEVVSREQFLAWMRARQDELGIEPTGPGIALPQPAAANTELPAPTPTDQLPTTSPVPAAPATVSAPSAAAPAA